MKKITAIFLLLAIFVPTLASCTIKKIQEEYKNDRYFYECLRLADERHNVLVEFDVVAKSARIPCPDPLCDHGEGCIVSDISGCRTSRNYDYDDSGMIIGGGYDIYGYDEQTYKLEKLTQEKLANKVDFVECKGEKIIWSFFGEGQYTTDLNFQNKTPYEAPKEEYTLEINSRLPHSGIAFECYRKDNESGEKALVFAPASSYRYASYEKKDAFFYIPARLEQIGVDEATGEPIYTYRPTNKLVYVNAYDTSDTYTWEIPEGTGITTAFMHADNHREVGKYVAFPCNKTERGEAGERHTYGGIFVVDTETKEAFTLFYGEESRTID